MKYRYNIRLSESEALKLRIKLKEPIIGKHPLSTDWEIVTFNNIIYLTPARFIHTKKFQWEMHPKFEWKTKIFLTEPLHPKHMFFKISEKKIIPLDNSEPIPILELITNAFPFAEDYLNKPEHIRWNKKTGDLRSSNK